MIVASRCALRGTPSLQGGKMNLKFLAASAVLGFVLSACGSSSSVPAAGAGKLPAVQPTSAPTAAPVSGGGSAATAKRSTMTIKLTIPKRTSAMANGARRTKTISPGTAYVDVVLQSLNGNVQPVDGPYSVLIPVTETGSCSSGGNRGRSRAPQDVSSGCFSVSIPAPVGSAVYAVATLDNTMTMLDYADGLPVTVTDNQTATLAAGLNGVGASIYHWISLTNPRNTNEYNIQHGVDCPAYFVQYDPNAICTFMFNAVDPSGSDMAIKVPNSPGVLANTLTISATDLTTGQPLNIENDAGLPDPQNPIYQIMWDPSTPAGGMSGTFKNAGTLSTYNTAIHPDLSEIPPNSTDTVRFTAVLNKPSTYAFGPSVLYPFSGDTATYTWDYTCHNVTVPPGDPSGVQEGSVFQYCSAHQSNLDVVIQ
jgi:plastocyanin